MTINEAESGRGRGQPGGRRGAGGADRPPYSCNSYGKSLWKIAAAAVRRLGAGADLQDEYLGPVPQVGVVLGGDCEKGTSSGLEEGRQGKTERRKGTEQDLQGERRCLRGGKALPAGREQAGSARRQGKKAGQEDRARLKDCNTVKQDGKTARGQECHNAEGKRAPPPFPAPSARIHSYSFRPCVARGANMGHLSAGGSSSWCPELEFWTKSHPDRHVGHVLHQRYLHGARVGTKALVVEPESNLSFVEVLLTLTTGLPHGERTKALFWSQKACLLLRCFCLYVACRQKRKADTKGRHERQTRNAAVCLSCGAAVDSRSGLEVIRAIIIEDSPYLLHRP